MRRYNIEIIISTKPDEARTSMVESAVVSIEAGTYHDALERFYRELKSCDTFQEFMDKVNNNDKYDIKIQ